MRNAIMYKEGKDSFVLWIKKRIKNNLNFLALASGPTGIGKSWSMLSVAYAIDKDFEVRQIAFNFKDVMEILNSDWLYKKKWKIILFDEAQCDIGSRQWQSLSNKLFNFLISTFRHRNVIFLMTSPYSDFLDLQSRKLLHCIFEIQGHNRKTQRTQIRPKLQDYNAKLSKFYEHSLFVLKNGKYKKMTHWFVEKPPRHLIEPYETAKWDFTNKLNKKIYEDLCRFDKKEEEIRKTEGRKPLTEKQEIVMRFLANTKESNKFETASKTLGLSLSSLSDRKRLAEKKGYTLEEFKEKEPPKIEKTEEEQSIIVTTAK
jgi:hypothetical protein